jgi:hypothetical protein
MIHDGNLQKRQNFPVGWGAQENKNMKNLSPRDNIPRHHVFSVDKYYG